jgi:peroxiredoxin
MKYFILCLSLILVAITPAFAFENGPAIGTHAPALDVRDSKAQKQDLDHLTGKNGVVVVFFRSPKWCPFCQAQLMSLKDAQAPLDQRGFKLIAISYDPPEILAKFADERGITYPLLSDQGSKVIDAFDIRDPQYGPASFAYGVPRPSIFVIDPKGVIRAKLAEEGYKIRPSLDAILAAADAVKN